MAHTIASGIPLVKNVMANNSGKLLSAITLVLSAALFTILLTVAVLAILLSIANLLNSLPKNKKAKAKAASIFGKKAPKTWRTFIFV